MKNIHLKRDKHAKNHTLEHRHTTIDTECPPPLSGPGQTDLRTMKKGVNKI